MPHLRPQLPRGAKPVPSSQLTNLARLLPSKTTILSGAGISTESGLSDYRSPGKPPTRPPISHSDYIANPHTRRLYWARSFVGYPLLSTARPNPAHIAIAALSARGFRHITQNVDGLVDALPLHGTVHRVVCLRCARVEARRDFQRRLRACNTAWSADSVAIRPDGDAHLPPGLVHAFRVPPCRHCAADALMPHLVFHGGAVPRAVADAATRIVDRSDALLVVGSSVTPYSAYRLVLRARRNGAFVACINFGPTRADGLYDCKAEGLVGDALARLAGLLPRVDVPAGDVGHGGCLQL